MDQMMFGTNPPIIQAIDDRILFLRTLIKDKTDAVKKAPAGSLRISSCQKKPQYFE
ncbi:MAG: hypothetical protein K6A92_03290 [Lachnospiraceae bacterium]|nr:hypothetical protein [Lachnospiraceae bacterium]